MCEGRAAGQALMNLFLLENTQQLPERRSDLWANQLMIYCPVLRPGTQGWHQPQPGCLETLPRGRQAARGRKSSCQLPAVPPGCPHRPERAAFVCFISSEQAGVRVQWSAEGLGNGPGPPRVGVTWARGLRPARCCPRALEAPGLSIWTQRNRFCSPAAHLHVLIVNERVVYGSEV